MSGQRGPTPDDTARIHAADPWAHTAPLTPEPDGASYPDAERYDAERYDEGPDETDDNNRRMGPLAIAGMVCAIVISVGLVFVLLSPVFAGKPTSNTAPRLPGLLDQPPAATLAPQATPDLAAPTEAPAPTGAPSATSSPSRGAAASPSRGAASAAGNTAVEDAVVGFVNSVRRRSNCDPVRNDPRLRAAARRHSTDMATVRFLSHTGSDGSSAADRMRGAGYDAPRSENLARGFGSARAVMQGWLDNREQRDNILDCDARAVGVGVALHTDGTPYWTQVFGR